MIYSANSKKKQTRQQLYPFPEDKKRKKAKPFTYEKFLALKKEFKLK